MIHNLFVGEKDSCDTNETAEGNVLGKKKKRHSRGRRISNISG